MRLSSQVENSTKANLERIHRRAGSTLIADWLERRLAAQGGLRRDVKIESGDETGVQPRRLKRFDRGYRGQRVNDNGGSDS